MYVCPFKFTMVLFLLLDILYPYLLLDGASMGLLSSSSLLSLSSTPFLLPVPLPPLLSPLLLFFGFALSLCAWLASSSTSPCFPSVASLGILSGSPLLATLCSILSFYLILLYSPSPLLSFFLSFLSILLHLFPASSPPLKVFAQSGSAQRGNTLRTYDPKRSLAAMSGASSRWRRL